MRFFKHTLIAVGTVLSMTQCQPPKEENLAEMSPQDIHSFAKPNEAVVTHLDWDAKLDFDEKIITAKASLTIRTASDAKMLMLDTKNLHIDRVTTGNEEQDISFEVGPESPHMGRPLMIPLNGEQEVVHVYYKTSPDAEALQWLSPVQTAGKVAPFLFTQSQAILARSWVPIQDSPGIRFTYNAKVEVPAGLLALMSAENPKEKSEDGKYSFVMRQPIPAYLLALAVGDITYQQISDRSGVYAEPSVVEKAAYEFAELESMIQTAESLYGKYQWEVYDIIVLPPSFPFGGMENPRLTFATPTILAGDRSLTSLVAHELAHSWSGNLVTNATWNDFWLNEGFTVYFEQRIMEALYGREYAEMLATLSAQDLEEEVAQMIAEGHGTDTHLKLELTNRNPDDGMTSIAYDKGYLFLRSLEEQVGRAVFDVFLKTYFTENAFKVMTTEAFINYLNANLFEKNGIAVDESLYQAWIYGEGLPESKPVPNSGKFAKVEEAMERFKAGNSPDELLTDDWSSHEWLHFVRLIPEDMPMDQMTKLDEAFGFTSTGNAEILTAWLVQAINHQYEPAYVSLEHFLVNAGRRKFLVPLYGAMTQTESGMLMAKSIYEVARPNYHFVSTSTIDEMLSWKGE
jgi:aminopeptidase N